MLAATGYHLDLWDRQAAVLSVQVDAEEVDRAGRTAWAVEGSGAAWGWALDNLGTSHERTSARCWRAYREVAGRAANGLANYGSFVQKALESNDDHEWDNAEATLIIFTANRRLLTDLTVGSLECESGAPPPTDPPLP